MTRKSAENVSKLFDDIYRTESQRVLATLIRLLGGFKLAEDAMHEAFSAALDQWQNCGVPANPRAWLNSVGCSIPDSEILSYGCPLSLNPWSQKVLLQRKSKEFGITRVTSDRIDIENHLKGAGSTGRFREAGDWNGIVAHHVCTSDVKQIDGELLKRPKHAYEKS